MVWFMILSVDVVIYYFQLLLMRNSKNAHYKYHFNKCFNIFFHIPFIVLFLFKTCVDAQLRPVEPPIVEYANCYCLIFGRNI